MQIQIFDGINFLLNQASLEEKQAEWNAHMVKPFHELSEMIHMDITQMGIVDPMKLNNKSKDAALRLKAARISERVREALDKSYEVFRQRGYVNFPKVIKVGIFVSDDSNPIHNDLNRGFSGFGGIPGFLTLILSPSELVLEKIEPLTAHEFHHNVRYLVDPWPKDMSISVGKYLLDEGMAEAFAAELYGEDRLGHWSTGLSKEQLKQAKEIIQPHVAEKGFQNAQSYLFGDDMAETYGYPKRGLPHAAGYAVGYQWIKEYLAKTEKNVVEATSDAAGKIMEQLWG